MRRWLALLLLLAPAAMAEVTFSGKVELWNPVSGRYEAMVSTRVRVVLWETDDWDTLDPETTTAADGRWQVSRGNPCFTAGYGYQVIVYAEVPGFVAVLNTLPQVSGYQALMPAGVAASNQAVTSTIKIGGAGANVQRYACGGDDAVPPELGEKAFFIVSEMDDQRRQLRLHTVITNDAWEEKQVLFPFDPATGGYSRAWDAVYLPLAETFANYEQASAVCRREVSRGLLRDAYTTWRIPWGNGPAPGLTTPCDTPQRAWSEALPEYLAQYTFHLRYGRTTWPIGRLDDPARPRGNPLTDNRNAVAAELDGALWHLTHRGLDRPRALPPALAPAPRTYRDALDDPRLELLWGIVANLSPSSFVDGAANGDTVAAAWLANSPGAEYDIKRVLFCHGLRGSLVENEPTVQMVAGDWAGAACEVRLRLLDADTVDLDHMQLSLLVNKQAVLIEQVPRSRWRADPALGNVVETTWRYQHVAGAPAPHIEAQLDDGLVATQASLDLQPPATTPPLAGLVCDVLGVELSNRTAAPLTGVRLRAGFAGRPATELHATGGWSAPAAETRRDPSTGRLAELRPVPEVVRLEWQRLVPAPPPPARPTGKPAKPVKAPVPVPPLPPVPAPVTVTFTAAECYGLGEHTVAVPVDDKGSELRVLYRIGLPDTPLASAAADHLTRVLGAEPRATGARPAPALALRPATGLAALDARPLSGEASRLQRRIAQLQRDSAEAGQEIEWLLNPERSVGRAKEVRPGPPSKRALPGATLQYGILLARPESAFLARAAKGEVAFGPASERLRQRLEPLGRRVMAIDYELTRLSAEADGIRRRLLSMADQVDAAPLPIATKQAFLSTLPDALTRLRAVTPLGQDHVQLLAEQAETVRRALAGQAAAPKPPAAPARSWALVVLGVSFEPGYAERYCQERLTLAPRGERAGFAVVRCRLTNTGAKAQVPILNERLPGETRLECAGGEKAQLRDIDAAQAGGKQQSYAAVPVEAGASVDFALVFELPHGAKPSRLWFTLQNYPNDVGGEGETRGFDLPGA